MGNRQSQSRDSTSVEDRLALKDVALNPPNACVVGGGLAGLHAAYELLNAGFVVDVIDARSAIANPDDLCKVPLVGYVPPPTLLQLPFRRAFLQLMVAGELFAPPMLYLEGRAQSLFTTPLVHFLWSRMLFRTTLEQYDTVARGLAQDSTTIIRNLVKVHPSLSEASVDVPAGEKGAGVWISPAAWSERLAEICKSKGCRFLLDTEVRSGLVDLRHDTEYLKSLTLRHIPTSTESQKSYDVVVLAHGANGIKSIFTKQPLNLPVCSFGGISALCTPALRQRLGIAADIGVQTLTDTCGLSMIAPPQLPHLSPSTLSGLFIVGRPRSGFSSGNLETLLRTKLQKSLSMYGNTDAVRGTEVDVSTVPNVSWYNRTYSNDGLPVVMRVGALYNCFVFTGFGDYPATFAPSAARGLSRLVLGEALDAQTTALHPVRLGIHVSTTIPPVKVPLLKRTADFELELSYWSLYPKRVLAEWATTLYKIDGLGVQTRRLLRWFMSSVDANSTTLSPPNSTTVSPKN